MSKFGEEFEFPDEIEAKTAKAAAEAEDEKFEIEVEDDTPPEDRGRKPMKEPVEDPTEDELASYDEKVQNRIKKFTRGYHDERRAKETALREREAAEEYARQVLEENKRLQQQLANDSRMLIETSKDAASAKLAAAKQKYKEAVEAGDIDAQADAQSEIADATWATRRASIMQPVEVQEKDWTPPSKKEPDTPVVSRRTQRWLEDNEDWWGKDEEMTMSAMGLDKKLQKEYGPDYVGTEEYFRTIDKTLRKRFPEHFGEQSHEEDDKPRNKRTSEPVDEDDFEESPRRASKPATVVAPASRSTPPSRVKLKQSEATIARRLGVPIELYAKQVAQLRKGN